ncbi:MAG: hypothetical protein M1812_000934 [Candelaria pacifica]|nr:MAG: hypothetical protein M1812_000934 [Candelaria pacifica]
MARGAAAVPELSEYEKERAANIAKNQALLRELQLNAASAGIAPKKPAPKSSSTNKSHKRKAPAPKVKKEEFVPRRTSSRIAGLTADSEVAKRKAEEEYVAVQEAARVKRQRVSGDLDLSDIVVAGKQWDKSENFLVDLVKGKPYERTFGETEVKETGDKELRALRERMSGLELYDGFEPNRIKITPERIYSLGFHPIPNKPLIFAGDKLGNLGLFDASQRTSTPPVKSETNDGVDSEDEEEASPTITAFKLHSRTISAFQFAPHDHNALYSASYDSSIRKLDLAKGVATEVYAPASKDDDEPLSGVEIAETDANTIYFSTLEGKFGRHDMRDPGSTDIFQLSEKKIGGFSLHPLQPHLFATASLDRMLKIWDLRKINGKHEWRHPALVGEHESALSVSHAAFNSAGQVATASYDNTIKIHDFSNSGDWKAGTSLTEDQMAPSTIVKHNNQTGRWVTILRAQWQQRPQDSVQRFCIGNMNRFVDLYTAKGEQLAQLGGEGITAVPAVAQFHPSCDWVAAGTASGKLCLWM